MKKSTTYSRMITVLSIAIGISFAIGYGYYNKAVAKEQITTSVSINSEGAEPLKPITIDVADQGLAKKLLQPNHLIARYALKNEGKEPVTIQVDAINFKSDVLLESGSPTLEKPAATYVTTLKPGKSVRIKVRIPLANNNLNQSKQSLGVLRVSNQQTGLELGSVPVYVVDSTIAPLEKTSEIPSASHHDHKKTE